jgi:flagellar hook assembly protein FlgD
MVRVAKSSGQLSRLAPKKVFMGVIVVVGFASLIGIAWAATSSISVEPFTVGQSEIPLCIGDSVISMTHSVSDQDVTTISGISITGISSDCDGQFISLELIDSSGDLLDEIIWQVDLSPGDSLVTLSADGSSTSGSNTSDGSVSINYPASQSDPEGLASNLLARNVVDVQIVILQESRAALE